MPKQTNFRQPEAAVHRCFMNYYSETHSAKLTEKCLSQSRISIEVADLGLPLSKNSDFVTGISLEVYEFFQNYFCSQCTHSLPPFLYPVFRGQRKDALGTNGCIGNKSSSGKRTSNYREPIENYSEKLKKSHFFL